MYQKKLLKSKLSTVCIVDAEGVTYTFDWATFSVGASVFIPCVATDRIAKMLVSSARKRRIKLHIVVGERNGFWGVGVWRMR
jgi:ribosomal protein S5